MRHWIVLLAALAASMLGMAQAPAPTAKDTPAAAKRDAPAAIDLTKKGAATGLPPAQAAKAKSKAEATKGIKGEIPPADSGKAKDPPPSASK